MVYKLINSYVGWTSQISFKLAVNILTPAVVWFIDFLVGMRIALFVVLSCVCICFVHCVTITNWGNVHKKSIGAVKVFEKSSWFRVKTHTFTYPNVSFFSLEFILLWSLLHEKPIAIVSSRFLHIRSIICQHQLLASLIWTSNSIPLVWNSWKDSLGIVMLPLRLSHKVAMALIPHSFSSHTNNEW